MKIPLSWLRDYVEIELSVGELAHRLTLAGLEVEQVRFVGLPIEKVKGHTGSRRAIETDVSGLAWDPDRIVVGQVLEVMPHPNADRLVLCRLDDGTGEHTVLTGAPNLLPFKDQGPLDTPIKVAYAKEGAVIYDGHKPGWETMKLKPTVIRGVESSSMACSEKELGISEDHEGIIVLDEDAVPGTALVDYMGDVVFDIAITPNIARNANVLGVAREIAALPGGKLQEPSFEVDWKGPPIEGQVSLEIREPELNPRFVLGLIEGVKIGPSPYWVQRRLRLAGMRPINNIVDATNYVMWEIGEPLHAFDYDVLVERAGGKPPTIITRLPEQGERLTTLDEVERQLDDFTILVADTAGALSIGGIMGGAESEVGEHTVRVLLEGAAWNFTNIRRTTSSQKLNTEASYRFERGVHPAMAERGVRRGLEMMHQLSGGVVAKGLVDEYPLPAAEVIVEVTPADADRWLGIQLQASEMAEMLERLGFETTVEGMRVRARAPDHRLDIGEGTVGVADVMEEIARVYGYDRIPETQIGDTIPPQYGNPALEREERLKDLLVGLGLQEIITYRLTSPEREASAVVSAEPHEEGSYIWLANPISADKVVLRLGLLANVLEVVERNARTQERIAVFEIGPAYLPRGAGNLPEERNRLAIALRGQRSGRSWKGGDESPMEFFDLKAILEQISHGLHLEPFGYQPTEHASFHPGKCAGVMMGGQELGVFGEVHPLVVERLGLEELPLVACELDLDPVLEKVPASYPVTPVPAYPPVLEDIALIVEESLPAERVRQVIIEAGGVMLKDATLFDVYRGEQIGVGKKSLAYALVYQVADRTLTDQEAAELRDVIVTALKQKLGAVLREA